MKPDHERRAKRLTETLINGIVLEDGRFGEKFYNLVYKLTTHNANVIDRSFWLTTREEDSQKQHFRGCSGEWLYCGMHIWFDVNSVNQRQCDYHLFFDVDGNIIVQEPKLKLARMANAYDKAMSVF